MPGSLFLNACSPTTNAAPSAVALLISEV